MTEITSDQVEKEVLEAILPLAIKHLHLSGEFSDVTLEGTDGEHVQAHRIILAARSKVFKKLLFGDFAEAKDALVPVGFEGNVLHAIVEYCYTDKVSMCEETVCDPYMTPTIVSLSAAADYFEFPTLRKYAVEYACKQIMEFKLLSLPFLTAVDLIVGSDPRIRECAINSIQTDYTGSIVGLESKHITALSHSVLESIVSDNAIFVDEILLFLLVKQWSQGPIMEESEADEQQDDRKAIASALIVKHIRFDLIASLDLSNAVAASGLLTTEQLLEAYKSHDELAGKITSQPLFTKCMPYWETLKSTIATFGIGVDCQAYSL